MNIYIMIYKCRDDYVQMAFILKMKRIREVKNLDLKGFKIIVSLSQLSQVSIENKMRAKLRTQRRARQDNKLETTRATFGKSYLIPLLSYNND